MTTTEFDTSILDTPDREQQLAEAKEKIAGSVPLIEAPPSGIVVLPRGLLKGDSWEQEAEVRELTGADEETLARVREAASFYDHLLALGVVRIGSIDLGSRPVSERLGILQKLLLGERQQLLLAVVAATYGDTKTLNVTCPNPDCGAEQEVDLILSEDFKAKPMEDPFRMTYSFTTSKGDAIQYRLAEGADQIAVLDKKGAAVAEQNSLILSRVITQVNGRLLLDPLLYARSLSMRDRAALLTELTSKQPEIDLTLRVPCVGCGGEQVLALGWPDLFRP